MSAFVLLGSATKGVEPGVSLSYSVSSMPPINVRTLRDLRFRFAQTVPLVLLICIYPHHHVSAGNWEDQACMECHQKAEKLPESSPPLLTYPEDLLNGPHDGMSCVDCHEGIARLPHDTDLQSVNCSSCHEDTAKIVALSVHGASTESELGSSQACVDCHGSHRIDWTSKTDAKGNSAHFLGMCLQCHGEHSNPKGFHDRVFTTGRAYLDGIHYEALTEGNPDAPTCVDCHGSHSVLPRKDPESTVHPHNSTTTCGKCHEDISTTFLASVHGQSLLDGYREAPECTSCHNSHAILDTDDPESLTSPGRISELCSSCHSSPIVATKYDNLSAQQTDTFFDSIHGLSGQLGNTESANCASCHGVHNIFSPSDLRSTVHPLHLLETCQECHPKAGPGFVQGKVHVSMASAPTPSMGFVRKAYMALIGLTLGFMGLHNALVIFRHVADHLRSHRKVPTVKRFKRIHLVQHHLIASAFVLLVVTGFALKYPQSEFTRVLTKVGMTETVRGAIHRAAALAATILFIVHLIGLFFTRGGRKELVSLMIRPKDFLDFFRNVAYNLGKRKSPPAFDRYTYWEKMEYWALAWGMVIMTLTGCALWFPELVSWFLPRTVVNIAEAIHFYEAVLATGAILIWHLFFVVYHPKEYPLSTAMLTGEITESQMKEIHSAEYQRMQEERLERIERLQESTLSTTAKRNDLTWPNRGSNGKAGPSSLSSPSRPRESDP